MYKYVIICIIHYLELQLIEMDQTNPKPNLSAVTV